MPVTKDMLVTELQNLLRLTAFEQTIATVRRAQARTTALETELAENVKKARERSALIGSAIKQLGGTPDVVGSAVSKVGAFATTQLNQVQTLQGALLGDLTLEHQLRERARYARTLAVSLDETSLLPVFDRLETAQTATIEWLEERLAEVGRTGTSLLRATPVQSVVGSVRKTVAVPFGAVAGAVNAASALLWKNTPVQVQDAVTTAVRSADDALDKGVAAARKATQRTQDAAAGAVETVEEEASDAAEVVQQVVSDTAASVADTASDVVEKVEDVATDAAATVEDTVEQAVEGADTSVADLAEEAKEAASELSDEVVDLTGTGDVAHPFAGYEKLSGDRIMNHVRETEDVAELEQLLAFEAAHKARKGVLAAAQERLTALSAGV